MAQLPIQFQQINIASINVNSIIANYRRLEFLEFLKKHKHDIILLSETKLNSKHKIQFQNYTIIRTDRPNSQQGGGTAIVIRKDIPFEIITYPSSSGNHIIEFTIIKIRMSSTKKLYIISVYATNDSRALFLTELDQLFERLRLQQANTYYIMAGDFNARRKIWGDRANNQRGRYFAQWEVKQGDKFKTKILTPSQATFYPAHTFLDICLIDARLKLLNHVDDKLRTLPYDSDHAALSLVIQLDNDHITRINPNDTQLRLNYKSTNWKKFTGKLDNSFTTIIPDNQNLSINEINNYLSHISEIIMNTINTTVPRIAPRDNLLKYLNSKIKRFQRNKAALVSLLHTLHITDPTSRNDTTKKAKAALRATREKIRLEFQRVTEKYWSNQIKKIDYRNSDTFFPNINRLLRAKQWSGIDNIHINNNDLDIINRSECNITELQSEDDKLIFTTTADKLNIIGAFYETINSPRPLNTGTRIAALATATASQIKNNLNNIRHNNQTITNFSDNNKATSPDENHNIHNPFCNIASVSKILKYLPNKTSSGLDNIPPIVLKHLPIKITRALTILFNNSINNYYFPSNWKRAKVLPILKKNKNANDPSSYRPISLTPSLSKVYEAIINTKISNHCNSNNIIPDLQFGFRYRHSTTHAIHKLLSDLNKWVGRSQIVGAALLDLEKAFDSVWLDGLLYKLKKKNFPDWLTFIIWDMISGKTFVTWDGTNISSKIFDIKEGLQQGTVNSPILFNIFTADLLNLFDMNNGTNTASIAFADDVIVYTKSNKALTVQSELEKITEKINQYYIVWNLRINPLKCETILFKKPVRALSSKNKAGSAQFCIETTIPGSNIKQRIPHNKTVKYLGIHLDYLLRGNLHLANQICKARKALQANYSIFYNKYLSSRTKIILYMLLIRPIITYAAPIWWNTSQSMIEQIRTFERKCLRICLYTYRSAHSEYKHYVSNKNIYDLANIPRIDLFTLRLTRDYHSKLPTINNTIIRTLSRQDPRESEQQTHTGYLTPEAFTYCDDRGLLQNANNIPILYHWKRNKADKRVSLQHNDYNDNMHKFTGSTSIPNCDFTDFHRLNFNNYWWLNFNSAHIRALADRKALHDANVARTRHRRQYIRQ